MKTDIHVLATMDLSNEQRDRILAVSDRIELSVIPEKNADHIPDEKWQKTEVLFTRGVLPDPEKVPHLKWLQFQSVGIDPFIDHALVHQAGVVTTSMSGAITNQVAEYAVMSILALSRKIPLLFHNQKAHKWPKTSDKHQQLVAKELRHSSVAILGYGSIGRQIARLLKPFGATILAAKRNAMQPEDTGFIPEGMGDPHGDFFDRLYPIEALHSLLSESDFVVLSLPLTENTHHLIDEAALGVMKPSGYLINVGRGALIDQEALIEALRTKQIAGAALDVFEEEPLPEDSPLWELSNVILSPHIAGLSQNLHEETFSFFIENLNRYCAGLPLYNQVDLQAGY